ncbi:AAA family ATPase [Dongia sp.]|uniref:AAA family ATPase n=1 Tax=Dongia sp. TaxID=1977262 RepID=UPI003753B9D8
MTENALDAADGRWSDEPGGRHHRRFQLVRLRDLPLLTEPSYLIKGIFPREGLAVVWGRPKCGKSFWLYDACLHIAMGWPYRGRRVTQAPVIYIACEGARGLGARNEAFRHHHGLGATEDPPFYLLTTRLDLATDAGLLIADIRAQLPLDLAPGAIAIDTLNRSIAGSESSDEDMGAYIKACDAIREAFGCSVILVHHSGIDGSRPRGHTSLTGAADAQVAVKREAGGLITATVEWLKDGAEGDVIGSRLVVMEVGTDDDGDPITSCAIVPADDESPEAKFAGPKLSPACRIALEALVQAIGEAGEVPPSSVHIPGNVKTVNVELWRKITYARDISGGQQNAKRMAFDRASKQLQARGLVGAWNDHVWPVGGAS